MFLFHPGSRAGQARRKCETVPFKFESVFNLEFQPEFGIQIGIPILMGINLGECECGSMPDCQNGVYSSGSH